MSQLTLSLSTQLPYSSENFVEHGGVSLVLAECSNHLTSAAFRICYVHGPARSGKTHTSIYLADQVLRRGVYPRLLEGVEELLSVYESARAGEVFIIDEAERYFESLSPGASGPFVQAIESLRQRAIPVVLFSRVSVGDLPCDQHVKSRLMAGAGLSLGNPGSHDMVALIISLARQRGLELRNGHIEFLEKRLTRSIQGLEHYLDRVVHLSRVLNRPLNYAVLGDACEFKADLVEIPT